jgi:zinc protease
MNTVRSSHLPGPDDIARRQLSNGIVVLSRANPASPSVSMHGYLHAGSLFDTDEKLGLAGFTAAALMRGTQRRNFQQIFDLLESSGASLGFGGGAHTTSFHGKALAEDLEMLLGLLSDALRMPIFPDEYVQRLRAQLLAGLAIRAQDTGDMAGMAMDELLYPGHPYQRPDDGYPETIQAIGRDDLVAFHSRHYGPRSMVIAIVGGIEPQQALDLVERILGDWRNPGQPAPLIVEEPPALPATTTRRVVIPGKSQADLLVGVVGPRRAAPDYLPASIGNNILGQFGMMGRIGERVREQAGLAYYAGSSLGAGLGPGPWDVSAGVDPANLEQAIALIQEELRRFISEPVTADELADTKANYIGRLPLSLESNNGVASALINLERYQLGLDYYRRYPDLVRAVTAEQALAAAQHYIDVERLAIASAGP